MKYLFDELELEIVTFSEQDVVTESNDPGNQEGQGNF